jgi:hypothetical protein
MNQEPPFHNRSLEQSDHPYRLGMARSLAPQNADEAAAHKCSEQVRGCEGTRSRNHQRYGKVSL